MDTRENKTEIPLWDSFCVEAVPSSRVAEDSRTAFQGGAIPESRGPTAGKGGHAIRPRGNGISNNRASGSLHSQCKCSPPRLLSPSPQSRLPESFLWQASGANRMVF